MTTFRHHRISAFSVSSLAATATEYFTLEVDGALVLAVASADCVVGTDEPLPTFGLKKLLIVRTVESAEQDKEGGKENLVRLQ